MQEQSTWTMDDSARAGAPGNTKVSFLTWFKHYPKWPVIYGSLLFASLIGAVLLHWSVWILFAISLGLNWYYWQRVKEHFLHGNVTPAMIVNMDPMMYAVLTNLTKGPGDFRAIKIIQRNFDQILGKPPALGAMFPTVSLYQEAMDETLPHWESFDPRPVEFATSDAQSINRVLRQLEKSDWEELKLWLKRVPLPFKVGLYHVEKKATG